MNFDPMPDSLARFLRSTNALLDSLEEALGEPDFDVADSRTSIGVDTLLLTLQQSDTVRFCVQGQMLYTATQVLNLQYEAMLRAAWVLFVASEDEVTRLDEALSSRSGNAAALPEPPQDALAAIAASSAPDTVKNTLKAVRSSCLDGAKGSMCAALETQHLCVDQLAQALCWVQAHSNELAVLAFALMAQIDGDAERQAGVSVLSGRFATVLRERVMRVPA